MLVNPVIVKELRGRMRGSRAAVVLVIYLGVLSFATWMVYLATQGISSGYNGSQPSQMGKILFGALVSFQTIMVSLLTPAFTAGSITSEREQKTYDLLVTTLLPARSIIFGKLGSALAYVVLLILAIAPIESMAFMFGGVSPEEIILSQVVMLAAALLFASTGIFWSALLRSSVASNVLTYGTILFLLIGVPFLYLTVTSIMTASSGGTVTNEPAFYYVSGVVLSSNPLVAMGISEALYSQGDSLFIYTTTNFLNGQPLLIVSPWLVFCIEALLLSTILILISIRKVQPIRYRSHARRAPQPAIPITLASTETALPLHVIQPLESSEPPMHQSKEADEQQSLRG
jgi:ABC-type transport system involved in multi-copper enzyme maturation permease subunit